MTSEVVVFYLFGLGTLVVGLTVVPCLAAKLEPWFSRRILGEKD